MSQAEMTRLCQDFVQAAQMAHAADFDMLQLHFAHGYLPASFISPLTNIRTDDYGGSLENRLRYPLQLLAAVREVWPANRPLSVAITAADWARHGLDIDQAVAIAAILKTHGCDLIEVLAGQTIADDKPNYDPYALVPYSDQIRNQVGIPTLVSGAFSLADQVNTILAAGRADLCLMDPHALRDE
jgi:anthraniloyl-CoA monooxygenase